MEYAVGRRGGVEDLSGQADQSEPQRFARPKVKRENSCCAYFGSNPLKSLNAVSQYELRRRTGLP